MLIINTLLDILISLLKVVLPLQLIVDVVVMLAFPTPNSCTL